MIFDKKYPICYYYVRRMTENQLFKVCMNTEIIAKRVREERERLDWNQTELAKRMGWQSHGSVVALEKGEKGVKAWELLKLASIFNLPIEALYSETKQEQPSVFWRVSPSRDGELALHERKILQHCEDYSLVKTLAGDGLFEVCKLPAIDLDINKATTKWSAELAESIWDSFQLGPYPAATLANILEKQYGVLIISQALDEGSAACCREKSSSSIVVNSREVPWRQNFSLAHELFHLLTWNNELFETTKSNKRIHKKNEQLAEAFAAALLMPTIAVRRDFENYPKSHAGIIAMAREYQVSTHALLIRLSLLGLISRKAMEETLKDPSFKHLDKESFKKAFDLAPKFGNRFVRLAYLAYESGRLSKARLARMFYVKLRDVDAFLTSEGLPSTEGKTLEADNN